METHQDKRHIFKNSRRDDFRALEWCGQREHRGVEFLKLFEDPLCITEQSLCVFCSLRFEVIILTLKQTLFCDYGREKTKVMPLYTLMCNSVICHNILHRLNHVQYVFVIISVSVLKPH